MTFLGYIIVIVIIGFFVVPLTVIAYYIIQPIMEKAVWRWDRKRVEKLTSMTTLLPHKVTEATLQLFTQELKNKMLIHRCHIGSIQSITTTADPSSDKINYLTVWYKTKAYERKPITRKDTRRTLPRDSYTDAFKFNL